MSFEVGQIASIPVYYKPNSTIDSLVKENIELSKKDWDSFETSWDFEGHPLVWGESMKCSDVLEIIKSVQPIATIIVAFISAYLAYKNTIKNSINQEKIKEYSEILDMLYELKSNTSIFLHNTEYIERLKQNRAKILLFSSKKLFEEIDIIYSEISKLKNSYLQEREPESLEEDEEQTLKYNISDKLIADSIEKIVKLMRKELKVKGTIKWEN